MITVLQRCLVKPVGSASTNPLDLHSRMDEEDPAFEWICLLFRVLFEASYAKDLYNAVGAHMLSRLWSRVTPEQLILLRMLRMWVTSHADASRQPGERQAFAHQQERGAVASPALFEFVKNTWVYVITVNDEDRPEEAEEVRKLMWRELENEAKMLLLDTVGEITQYAPLIWSGDAQLLLLSLLEELQRVWELRRLGVNQQGLTNISTAASDDNSASAEPFGYRSGIIRAIGNLCYRHTGHQDVVREQGYLVLFLNHCNIDDANPMVREWSLVALRNLCEGNEANQQYINALKPQSADPAATQPVS